MTMKKMLKRHVKLSVIKLDRLDDFIDSVKPEQKVEDENDLNHIQIDISKYFEK